jgi:hypothetical protein
MRPSATPSAIEDVASLTVVVAVIDQIKVK